MGNPSLNLDQRKTRAKFRESPRYLCRRRWNHTPRVPRPQRQAPPSQVQGRDHRAAARRELRKMPSTVAKQELSELHHCRAEPQRKSLKPNFFPVPPRRTPSLRTIGFTPLPSDLQVINPPRTCPGLTLVPPEPMPKLASHNALPSMATQRNTSARTLSPHRTDLGLSLALAPTTGRSASTTVTSA